MHVTILLSHCDVLWILGGASYVLHSDCDDCWRKEFRWVDLFSQSRSESSDTHSHLSSAFKWLQSIRVWQRRHGKQFMLLITTDYRGNKRSFPCSSRGRTAIGTPVTDHTVASSTDAAVCLNIFEVRLQPQTLISWSVPFTIRRPSFQLDGLHP